MRRLVTRDDFVKQITIDRNKLGEMSSRGNPAVSRSQFPAGAQVPEGFYLNVAVPTTFAESEQPVRETVSFRLDEDKVWRVSGYSLRGRAEEHTSELQSLMHTSSAAFCLKTKKQQ